MDDLISRQDAIDELKACREIYCDNTPESFSLLGHSDKSRVDEIDNAIAILVNLPSAQPRKKGKWIATQEWGERNYSCSCCKFSFIVDTCMLEPMWNYCPNCGCEMERSDND